MITNIDEARCTGCGICVETCPLDILRLNTCQEEVPPCLKVCPAHVDIRGYINLLKQGDFRKAIELIRESLPLPAVTGYICHFPCESACARKKVDDAVNINSLERFVADYWLKEKARPVPRRHAARVAVVGSGPAGLSAAYFLCRKGYAVTIFESKPKLGGMIRYDVLATQLPRKVLDAQIRYIKDMGVEMQTSVKVGKDVTLEGLKEKGYHAVFVTIVRKSSKDVWHSLGLNITSDGTLKVDARNLTTGIPGVFASRDAATGKASVVEAIASGRKAATVIDLYLKGEDLSTYEEKVWKVCRNLPGKGIAEKERQKTPILQVAARDGSFVEERQGLSEKAAMEEATRCMTCGSKAYIAHPEDCMTCFVCELNCPYGAVDVHPFKEVLPRSIKV